MPKFGLDISITPESVHELEDCVLLLKWRLGMEMSREEVGKLECALENFDASNVLLVKFPWGTECKLD